MNIFSLPIVSMLNHVGVWTFNLESYKLLYMILTNKLIYCKYTYPLTFDESASDRKRYIYILCITTGSRITGNEPELDANS